ncbi:MAG: hypothetical protein CO183_00095 [Candidatus Zambryskibacteria bacterium CG_4_9_14_3_um_filter_42_9]|uniref:Uncharacterized protein n=1 Tax=Candidatus Zambryskibacteria bacterium CG22_combo_CG10-13_8_21_14_all_42_17 TaxID=1975118 RepID=A0A2H0BDV1_9BACT|nr:MAG: hypothetical protein COX06_01055 [Candidatus Zambryskibacteria bacterium CG22_combo_CG10-13_8_21_14_all_42_17]PJA37082.1 MAG: hypothetical protein CO183_00095 [Candidatus Zambryskibacteria bacterium CG_4_9_14_3_um_filter_42_9]
MREESNRHEQLALSLKDENLRREYAAPFDNHECWPSARFLAWLFVKSGTLIYGDRPSYAKFKAIEVIARVPYQSWELGVYTILTSFYTNERLAMVLSKFNTFSRLAQDNETMHVVVISQIVKRMKCERFFRHTIIPFIFSFFYFWTVYILFIFSKRSALDLNYLFESHAYEQYQKFLDNEGDRLRQTPILSDFLNFYGRSVRNEYEFFELVRNDELIHRNRSAENIEE